LSKKHGVATFRSARRAGGAVLQRKKIEIEPGRTVTVDVNCAESPLSWLRTRKDALGNSLINDEQYCAGLRLHADFTASQLMPRITSNWQTPIADGAGRRSPPRNDLLHQSETILAAKQRYYATLEAVGPELSPILVEICCYACGIEAAERILNMPRRSGKVVLQLALTRLARLYGLIAPEKPRFETPIRSCALDGYRPRIP
jgi:hypothetical protein